MLTTAPETVADEAAAIIANAVRAKMADADELAAFHGFVQEQIARTTMGGWRAIESAPTDGTIVLLWAKNLDEPVAGFFEPEKGHRKAGWRQFWTTLSDIPASLPTHWHAMPKIPT